MTHATQRILSLNLKMTPPNPDEFSNEMLEFLLQDAKLSDHLLWKQDILRSEYQYDVIRLPCSLTYSSMSEKKTFSPINLVGPHVVLL